MRIVARPLHKNKIMRGLLFIATAAIAAAPALAAVPATGNDGVAENHDKVEQLDSVIVSASRAGKKTPVTYSMVGKEELCSSNPINSLPMTLNLLPSVVTSNEGGTGLGYSTIRVRGSKGSQINVTLNGITLNDSESQEVFWVNIPALTNILNSVQVQRGLGTSANGSGAFGASINMNTASVGSKPYAYANIGAGSYNTLTTTVSAGTGLTKSGFYASAAYSKNFTDGYIRNAYADVQSAFAALGWMNSTNSLRFTYLMGDQRTGLTWDGISYSEYETDRRTNWLGAFSDALGNTRFYDNETDNYTQHHFQLNYTHQFEKNVAWSTTLNYTKGDGYYEQYKQNKKLTAYGLPSPVVKDDVEYTKSDAVIRKYMDNYYLVLTSDVKYTADKLNLVGGIYLSRYDGDHFGKAIWSAVLGDYYDYDSIKNWYNNNGLKQEANAFARAEYTPVEWLTAYVDLQYRGVFLNMSGPDDDGYSLDYKHSWNFFNPRAGLTFNWNDSNKAYISAALGHREPGRDDLQENLKTSEGVTLKPESMVDLELGYTYTGKKVTASANLYLMEYWDMLLEDGRISNTGDAIKTNVGRSWRRGVEIGVAYRPSDIFRLDANLTLSINKIKDYTDYIPVIDNQEYWDVVGMTVEHIGKTTMLMSPSLIGMAQLAVSPFAKCAKGSLKTTTLSLNGKYVGSQFWDNTESNDRKIPGYFVANLSLSHDFKVGGGVLGLRAYVNNFLNNKYYSNVWVARVNDQSTGERVVSEGVYPQAPANFMFGVTYSF